MEVAKDKSEALVTYVQVREKPNNKSRKFAVQGLIQKQSINCGGTERYSGEI